MKDLELRLTDLLARKADEVDVRPVDGFAETPYTTALAFADLEPTSATSAPKRSRGRVAAAILATAAAVVAIAVVATRDDDAAPADQPSPSPTVTVPSTSPPQALTEWVVPPLGPPIECQPKVCRWSPELTAHTLEPLIACDQSCPQLVVSPDGTLVALDKTARRLIWYEDEPRVVSLGKEIPPGGLWAIGPYDIAYIWHESEFIAVAPSGAEITRMAWSSNRNASPTAAGLVPMETAWGATPGWPESLSLYPTVSWVDLDGNPIIDTRPYPTATATDAGIEVRFGEREWLVTDRWGPLEFFDFRPRSDGGVVMTQQAPDTDAPYVNVLELLPDGTIERYFVPFGMTRVLPDGSVITEHDHQLVRLTPPAA